MTPREALAQAVEAMRRTNALFPYEPDWWDGQAERDAVTALASAISAAEAVLATPERDEAAEERKAAVAWLRDWEHEFRLVGAEITAIAYDGAADGIEDGEHRKKESDNADD